MEINKRTIACVVMAIVATSVTGHGQQSVFRGQVELVRLDVSVLDKQRRPVRDLTAAEFTVLVDGKPRPIVAFTQVEVPAWPVEGESDARWRKDIAADVVDNAVAPEGRLVVIGFDETLRAVEQRTARRAALAAIDSLGPEDLAAVVFISRFSNAGVPQNLTRDKALLRKAVDQVIAAKPESDEIPREPAGLPPPPGCSGISALEQVTDIAVQLARETTRRKTLLWIAAGIEIYPQSHCNLEPVRDRLVREARRSNLTIDVIDAVGLDTDINMRSPGVMTIVRQARFGALEFYAQATGGRLVTNTNTPETFVPAIVEESSSYYLIGFAPIPLARGAQGKIVVKVKRAGLAVRAPSDYPRASETIAAGDRVVVPLERALGGLRPDAGLALSVAAAPFAHPGQRLADVAVLLSVPELGQVPASSPVNSLDGHAVGFTVMALTPKAKQVAQGRIDATLDFGAALHVSADANREVRARLGLEPGVYEIRAAIDAGDGQTGSVFTYVDVPDFAKEPVSLSGLVVEARPSTSSIAVTASTDFLPLTPTLRRSFVGTDTLHAFLRAYQRAGPVALPAVVTMRVVDASGRTRRDGQIPLDANRFGPNGVDVSLTVPLAELPPGEYLLSVAATVKERTASRDLRFTVVSNGR